MYVTVRVPAIGGPIKEPSPYIKYTTPIPNEARSKPRILIASGDITLSGAPAHKQIIELFKGRFGKRTKFLFYENIILLYFVTNI